MDFTNAVKFHKDAVQMAEYLLVRRSELSDIDVAEIISAELPYLQHSILDLVELSRQTRNKEN